MFAKTVASLHLKPRGWKPGDPAPEYPFVDGLLNWTWTLGSVTPGAGLATKLGPFVFAILFWGLILYFVAFKPGKRLVITQLGGALAFGGIAGNLTDTIIFGGVRNFMQLAFDNPFWSPAADENPMLSQRPSFSTAAVALWVGVVLLVVGGLLDRRRNKPEAPPPPRPPIPRTDSKRPYGYQEPR